jgi:DGQHR domain-containing protein
MKTISYVGIKAIQSTRHTVVSFAAKASEILQFARVEPIGRDDGGALRGFQRPQIISHIKEIANYLSQHDAILPNPIVVAFVNGVSIKDIGNGIAQVMIDVGADPLGFVVDGQQRLKALQMSENGDFEIFVSLVLCEDEADLKRQFVLINNTKPLPKPLIYELLPGVDGLPQRLAARSNAADLTAMLNFDERSSLRGMILQQTNPRGVIKDTAIQKLLMNSISDGILRELLNDPATRSGWRDHAFMLVSDFFRAVASVFRCDWNGHVPRTSRLVHNVGIGAMGITMDILACKGGARSYEEFVAGLQCLVGPTAWSRGTWTFGDGTIRRWNEIQTVASDIRMLNAHIEAIVNDDVARRFAASSPSADLPVRLKLLRNACA